ncbi:Mdm33 family-domain-containing protein [Chlamydoabsidia padenii]|nr:Mdm33 family-domain-containing protein [Chlamydoabsidia padenii]
MTKLQQDIQPLIHKVQDAANTLKRLTQDVTDSKDALRRAGMALNELTGYNQIELVKKKVMEQAKTFELTRDQVQVAKKRYELAIATRSSTQRGINELLQRKHLWTGDDVTQFTELYRLEHEHAKEEDIAKEHYHQKEKQMDREYMALARSIMERYHDEQLWSDKIRSVSTYGTWALMVLNLMLFVAVQTVFEPRKRKRLTDRFEELLVDKVAEQEEKFGQVAETMARTDQVLLQQQQILVDLVTQLAESGNTVVDDNVWTLTEQENTSGRPPIIITEQQDAPTDITWTTPLENDNIEYNQHTLITNDYQGDSSNDVVAQAPGSVVLSQRSLILYSLESAVAGGLITALAVFLWK